MDSETIVGWSIAMFLVGICLSVMFLVVTAFTGFHYETGSGNQVGYVSSTEKSGVFFKTYTAYIKPELESTQEDVYCVLDEEVVKQLEDAAVAKQRVKVSHFSWFAAGITNCGGEPAIISGVEVIQ